MKYGYLAKRADQEGGRGLVQLFHLTDELIFDNVPSSGSSVPD